MGDANGAMSLAVLRPFGADFVGQAGDLTHSAQGQERIAFLDRETGRIITAIFQTT
jgi:hypothetical protein